MDGQSGYLHLFSADTISSAPVRPHLDLAPDPYPDPYKRS